MLTFDELIVAGSDSGQYFRPMVLALKTSLYLIWKKYQVLTPVAELRLDDLRNQFSTPEDPHGLEKHLHGGFFPWTLGAPQLFCLGSFECFVRNNGFVEIGVKVPIHEAVIFELRSTCADSFLEQHPACVFFIGQQLIERLPVPFRLAGGGKDAFRFQCRSDFSQAVSTEVTLKNPADNSGLIGIDCQLAVRPDGVAIAPALGHFGGAILKTFA